MILYVTVLVIATCGLVFELLAGAVAAYLLGDSVTQFATVIGLYLSAMGAGAWATRHVEREAARRFVECQLAAAVAGGGAAPALFVAFAHMGSFRVVLYLVVALTGALVGAELPLLLRVLRRRVAFAELVARVLAVDYVGALLGSVLLGVVVLPRLGLVRAGVLFGLLNAAAALWGTWALAADLGDPRPVRVRAVVVLAALAAVFAGAGRVEALADGALFPDPVVFTRQTPYQRLVLTRGHGGVNLYLDGNLQFASADEYRYHEALVHPALALAPRRGRVLILGGGDGLAAREVLRHPDVRAVTLVDLDRGMTDLARGLPWLRGLNRAALHDPRVTVVNDDAMVWLARPQRAPDDAWDAAIVDFPDPNAFALGKLYTTRFYRLLRARLRGDAVVVVQSTSPLVARRSFWCVVATLEAAGYRTLPYHAAVPSFGEWGFVLASAAPLSPPTRVPAGLRYLTPATLPGLFAFPPDMARVPVEVNRLNNQVLVRYYEEEWHRLSN